MTGNIPYTYYRVTFIAVNIINFFSTRTRAKPVITKL